MNGIGTLQSNYKMTEFQIHVTPDARKAVVAKVSEDYFEGRVDERAFGGRANKRLLEILAEHFKIPETKNHHPERNKN